MGKKVSYIVELKAQTAEIKKANEAITVLNDTVKGVEESVKEANSAFAQWTQTTMALSALSDLSNKLNGHIQECASSFDDFDQAMRAANTMMGLGEDGFQDMKDALSEMSKEIPKSRKELADGLYQVISNGVTDPVQALQLLETSARSSVGGIADLGQVVGVTATIWKNYGLDASAAGDIQDKIQLTAKNGVTSFEQLAAALPAVSGNAATLGVSIDELLASFATLTGVSGNTAAVSTQLGAVFTALVKPSSEASKMAEEMGIRFDAATIKAAGGFEQFLAQLKVAVSEYSASSGVLEQEVYGRLFGSAEAMKALIPLQGELASKYSENVSAMNDSTGTMDEAFGQMAQTGGAVRQMLQNSVQAMTDWMGSVASAIAPTMDYLTVTGDVFMSLTSIAQGFTTTIPAIKGMVSALVNSEAVTKAVTIAQAALNAVLAANPVAMIALALAGLGAILYTLYQNSEVFRGAVDALWEDVKEFASVIVDIVVTYFKVWWGIMQKVFGWINQNVIPVVKKAINILGALAAVVLNKVVQGFRNMSKAIQMAWGWIKKMLVSMGLLDDNEKAIENNTDAIKDQADAYDDLSASMQNSIKLQGVTSTGKTKKGDKAPAPQGSLKALQEQIQAVQAKVELEVDPQKRAELYKELDKLKNLKLNIEAKMKLDAAGYTGEMDKMQASTAGIRGALDSLSKGDSLSDMTKRHKKSLSQAVKDNEAYAKSQEELAKSQPTVADGLNATSNVIGSVAQAIGSLAGESKAAAVAQRALAIAGEAVALAGAISSATKGDPYTVAPRIAAAVAAVVAGFASFASLPKFANGGIISGPTIGLMGEYSGASNNPEVVAPLNKLKSMLGDVGGGMDGRVQFEIKGRKLVGVLARENSIRSRS